MTTLDRPDLGPPAPPYAPAAEGGRIHGSRGFKLGAIVLFLLFLLLGLAATWAVRPLASRRGEGFAAVLILLLPVILAVFAVGARRALAKFQVLRREWRWWHWPWLFLLVSGFVLRVRDPGSAKGDPADAAALFRIGLVALTAFLLAGRLVLRRPDWLRSLFQGLVGAMTAFALVSAVSAIWSVNPPWTLYKSLEYLVDVALLAAIVAAVRSGPEYETLFDWNWTLCGLLIASAWMGALIWPHEALEEGYSRGTLGYRLSGIFPGQGSNRLGDLGAILGAVCFARLFPVSNRRYDRLWYGLVLAGCALTIVFSQTRTAIGGLGLAILLILVLTRRLRAMALVGVVVVGAAFLLGLDKVIWSYLQRGQSQAEMVSFSSRLDWWSMAWELLKEHPWTGLGAFAAGPFAVFDKLGMNNLGPLHSDYIETVVGTSFWGVVPLVAALLGSWWVLLKVVRNPAVDPIDRQLALEAIAVLSIVTIRSVFMTFMVLHPPLNYLILVGYAESLRRRRNASRQGQPRGAQMAVA